MRRASASGLVTSRLRYGFDVDSQGVTVPNEVEQEVIRRILEWKRRGKKWRWMANLLNKEGKPAKAGGVWSHKSVKSVWETNRDSLSSETSSKQRRWPVASLTTRERTNLKRRLKDGLKRAEAGGNEDAITWAEIQWEWAFGDETGGYRKAQSFTKPSRWRQEVLEADREEQKRKRDEVRASRLAQEVADNIGRCCPLTEGPIPGRWFKGHPGAVPGALDPVQDAYDRSILKESPKPVHPVALYKRSATADELQEYRQQERAWQLACGANARAAWIDLGQPYPEPPAPVSLPPTPSVEEANNRYIERLAWSRRITFEEAKKQFEEGMKKYREARDHESVGGA